MTYTKTFAEKHNLDAMIGGEYYTYNQFDFEAKTQGSPTDDVPTLNVGSERTFTRTEKRLIAFFLVSVVSIITTI